MNSAEEWRVDEKKFPREGEIEMKGEERQGVD